MDFPVKIYPKGMKPRTIGMVMCGVFEAKRSGFKHYFRKFDAWGIDYNALHNQVLPNTYIIHLVDEDDYIHYYTTAKNWIKHGQKLDQQVRRYKEGKKDHLAQVFLSNRHWVVKDEPLSPNEMYKLAKEIDSEEVNTDKEEQLKIEFKNE